MAEGDEDVATLRAEIDEIRADAKARGLTVPDDVGEWASRTGPRDDLNMLRGLRDQLRAIVRADGAT